MGGANDVGGANDGRRLCFNPYTTVDGVMMAYAKNTGLYETSEPRRLNSPKVVVV